MREVIYPFQWLMIFGHISQSIYIKTVKKPKPNKLVWAFFHVSCYFSIINPTIFSNPGLLQSREALNIPSKKTIMEQPHFLHPRPGHHTMSCCDFTLSRPFSLKISLPSNPQRNCVIDLLLKLEEESGSCSASPESCMGWPGFGVP